MNTILIALLYHRIGSGKHANPAKLFEAHLEALKARYPCLLPGEPLPKGISLLLTFDDASYDFYHVVFPLLQKFQLRALLGVPVRYILEESRVEPAKRLEVPYYAAMQDGIFEERAPFCTWKELETMVKSGLVQVASHSFSHKNLTLPFVNVEEEILLSKKLLEERLPQAVTSFIYPFGKWNAAAHQLVQREYAFSFRIGSASNSSWVNREKPLARICGDHLTHPLSPLSLRKRLLYRLKQVIP